MRILTPTVALLAVSGCMSNTARVQKKTAPSSEEVETVNAGTPQIETNVAASPANAVVGQPEAGAPESLPPPPEPQPPAAEKSECDSSKKEVSLPYFLKETSALVVGLEQTCKETEKKDSKNEVLMTKMSVIGVACTGSPGFITRRGHSNQNWEVVSFGMDLGCNMHPPEDIKVVGKKKLGFEVDPKIVSFVPMMIEYWEFEKNNDAGLGATPTLTANGGGAAQWKKNEVKNQGFPIKLYGHSSTLVKDQAVYEARAILMPKSNQRQFHVVVEEMKLLSGDDLKTALDRCMAKTNSKAACTDAFDSN